MIFLKTDEEIELLRTSNQIVAKTLGEIAKIIAPGVSTMQLNNLADELLSYNTEVDTEAYANVVKRYAPDRLGKVVYDFITSD